MEITIEAAFPPDIPALAEINRLAYAPELAARIAFPKWPDVENMFNFFTARIEEKFNNPNDRVCKAISTTSQEIVGMICWTVEGGEEGIPSKTASDPTTVAAQIAPEGLNMQFVLETGRDFEELRAQMDKSRHYYITTLVVPPEHQGNGIGSKLLSHCLSMADVENTSSWLIAFPGSRQLYLRYGFKDVDHRDMDLGKWDGGRLRGFGIYRNYLMVRKSQRSG